MTQKTFILAEAGVNHNAVLENAYKLVEIAKESGADAVKFQVFKEGECTGRYAKKVAYLDDTMSKDISRYEITRKLILDFEDFKKIKNHCDKVGIEFVATPDGLESLNFLVNDLRVKRLKIASTEVTNLPFLREIAKKKLQTIFSTGLSNLAEVEAGVRAMLEFNSQITILHCVSEYPAPLEDLNLKAIQTLSTAFRLPVGFSDHSNGYEASLVAVALGSTLLEKHFTIDRNMDGPDHKASLNPDELKNYILWVRNTEKMLGDGIKRASRCEIKNIEGIRRGVVAARPLTVGTVLSLADLAIKRPASGVHPYDLEKLVGFKLNRALDGDEPVQWDHLK